MAQRNVSQRPSVAPELGKRGQVYSLPANAVAGTAEPIISAIRSAALANNIDLDEGRITGLLISTHKAGASNVHLRTNGVLGAGNTGTGIEVEPGDILYLPSPFQMNDPLLYETTVAFYVIVYY